MDLHRIIQAAAQVTGVPAPVITSRRRGTTAVTDARSIVIAISRDHHPHLTAEDIAATVGRTNHGTTTYHLRRVATLPHLPRLITQAEALLTSP
jgi:chromosomal replication initiation ATPase DnaA